MPHNTEPRPQPARDPASELEATLAALIKAHEQMLQVTAAHRRAISAADAGAIQGCIESHTSLAGEILALDARRKLLIREICPQSQAPTIAAVLESVHEPARGRLTLVAARLRELVALLQKELAVVRAAMHAMAGHIDGLIQQMAIALSNTRLYDTRGRVQAGPAAVSGLDLTH